MRSRLRCKVTLRIESPFLFRGLEGSLLGVDAAQMRDSDGRPLLPGDQLKGVLRHALEDLAAAAPDLVKDEGITALFGRPDATFADAGNEGRSRLIASDLRAREACEPSIDVLPRVAIDENTGSAKAAHLQVVELVAPLGREVTFEGELLLFVEKDEVAGTIDLLDKALALVPSIGAFKTVGFGRVVRAAITAEERRPLGLPTPAAVAASQRYALTFTLDRPFMVATRRVEDNVMEGQRVIPGGVLKGALARRLEHAGIDPRNGAWGAALSRLSIGHAWPLSNGAAVCRPLPLSLTTNRPGTCVRDELRLDERHALAGETPLFPSDWKCDPDKVLRAMDWPADKPGIVMRTRTAIAHDTGAASEAQLFSYKMVDPTGWRWRAVIDLEGIDTRTAGQLLALLGAGLDGIGKTEASMVEVETNTQPQPQPQPVAQGAQTYALMLETPALMVDKDALDGAEALRGAVERYFSEASAHRLTLKRFYATQSLSGGVTALRRSSGYAPWILMDAGSVFLLEGDPAPLADWLRYGLPLPDWLNDKSWQKCPFQRENGFGAVSLNAAAALWDQGGATAAGAGLS